MKLMNEFVSSKLSCLFFLVLCMTFLLDGKVVEFWIHDRQVPYLVLTHRAVECGQPCLIHSRTYLCNRALASSTTWY